MTTLATRAGRRLAGLHLQMLHLGARERPLPLRYWLTARRLLRPIVPQNALLPPGASVKSTGADLSVPELRSLLHDKELGTWALDRMTIEFLWKRLWQEQPRAIIECGAGTSTMLLAQYAASCNEGCTIFSLEQNSDVKEAVERELAGRGLDGTVRVIHAPVTEQGTPDFPIEQLRQVIPTQVAQWVVIDGPAGPEGCRAWTLPLLREFCRPNARWFLDDALRDGELRVLQEWARLPGVTVEGIFPAGKGLATGSVHPASPVDLQ